VAGAQRDRAIEVGFFGRDGMSGTSLVLGDSETAFNCSTQVEGSAIRISAANLGEALHASASLKALLTGYAHALAIQTACTAWANADLRLEERLARWILMVDDRIDGNQFSITHEFLSVMLGVRRAGVTQALNALASRQLIDVRRGTIGVIDRAGLAAITKGTYGLAEAEYVRITGIPLGK
jgi:CRP-like cAMP-binding protein